MFIRRPEATVTRHRMSEEAWCIQVIRGRLAGRRRVWSSGIPVLAAHDTENAAEA